LASARKEDEGTTRLYADEDLRALELLWVLGRGGAGTVFAGRLHGLDVAVKVRARHTGRLAGRHAGL
jgi:hypothetical protein